MAQPETVLNEEAIERQCRHVIAIIPTGVNCEKHGLMEHCHYCATCPKCGCGTTYTEGCVADVHATGTKIIEVRICPLCGNRTRGIEIDIIEHVKSTTEPDQFTCEVEGCTRGAYELFTYKGWFICSFHKGQTQTHRYSRMEQSRFPLLVRDGLLVENVKFNLYKARRKG